MKKIFIILLSFITIFALTGCLSGDVKKEAEEFHQTYWEKGQQDFLNERAQLHDFKSEHDATMAFIDKIQAVKLRNKEVEPLKEKCIQYLLKQDWVFTAFRTRSKGEWLIASLERDKARFDYDNEYTKLTTGKPIPVLDTPKGQFRAAEVSNVLCAIKDHKGYPPQEKISNGYEQSARAQGEFVYVEFYIKNNQSYSVSFDSSSFCLIDKKGREYNLSAPASYLFDSRVDKMDGLKLNLGSGELTECKLVFDVPDDAAPFELGIHAGKGEEKGRLPLEVWPTGY